MKMPPLPRVQTPAGASSFTASAVVLALGLLNGWSWWAHQNTTVQTAAGVVLAGILSYVAAWLRVLTTPGQKITTELAGNSLPMLSAVAPAPEPRTEAVH